MQGATVNILSIGPAQAGKTVFLAGSYAELKLDSARASGSSLPASRNVPDAPRADQPRAVASLASNAAESFSAGAVDTDNVGQDRLQLELDNTSGQKLTEILDAIARTGQYPPATVETTEFRFRLRSSVPTEIDYLRWWDVSGKNCRLTKPDFQAMVLRSHGCCIFVNADALLRQPAYLQASDLQQIQAIAHLARHSVYPIAVILTQVDCLDSAALNSLQPKLQPLIERLEAAKADYRTFTSAIPIVNNGSYRLQPKAAGALIWLLSKLVRSGYQELGTRLRQSLSTNKLWEIDQAIPAAVQSYLTMLAMKNVSMQALPALEKLVQEEPENVQLQLDLARHYEHQGQKQQAETVYDRVLAKQDNLKALVGKALLRQAQGDSQTAHRLLAQAQQVAPSDWQAKINAIARQIGFRQLSDEAGTG